MDKPDATFSDLSAYGSDRWIAARLGKSYEWFRKKRPELEIEEGLPQRDRLTNFTLKADVDAWIERRRRIAASDKVDASHDKTGVNYERF